MTTSEAILSYENQVRSLYKWFDDHFTYTALTVVKAMNKVVDMDNGVGAPVKAAVEIYINDLAGATDQLDMNIRVVTRNAQGIDSRQRHVMRIADAARKAMRESRGSVPLVSYAAVTTEAGAPAATDAVMVVRDRLGRRGEAYSALGVREDGKFWILDLFYRAKLSASFAGMDHL